MMIIDYLLENIKFSYHFFIICFQEKVIENILKLNTFEKLNKSP